MPDVSLVSWIAVAVTKPWLAQAEPAAPELFGGSFMIVMVAVIFIFYFFMIRPQNKRQKEMRERLAEVKKNDRIVTAGGLFGTVVGTRDDDVTIRIDDQNNVRVRVRRSAIADILTLQDAKPADKPSAPAGDSNAADADSDTGTGSDTESREPMVIGAAAGGAGSGGGGGGGKRKGKNKGKGKKGRH